MNFLLLSLVFIFLSQVSSDNNKKCDTYLNRLKEAGSLFLICSMQYAVPVQFCTKCVTDHSKTVASYQSLLNATHHDTVLNTTEICKDKYFDQDRLNIVQTLYDEINGLWERAFCNKCFDEHGFINNITNKISEELIVVNSCLQGPEPCIKCERMYTDVNTDYINELERKHNSKVCFDLQDAMNRTRFLWSKKLHCCDREVNLTAFASVGSVFACLPIVFYVFMYYYTKRIERNHDMLIDNRETESINNQSSNQLSVTQDLNAVNLLVPGPSREAPDFYDDPKKLKGNFNNLDDSSDEELIMDGKPKNATNPFPIENNSTTKTLIIL